MKDIVSLITARTASPLVTIMAGGPANGTAVVGPAFQRSVLGLPRSAAVLVNFAANLSAGKALSLSALSIQDSADGVSFTPFLGFTDPGAVAGGPGAFSSQILLRASLDGARDFVRFAFTPTLTALAMDTASLAASLLFFGASRLPAP